MARNIKKPEADRLAHELAEQTGDSLTGVVVEALRDRLAAVREGTPFEVLWADVKEIQAFLADLPDRDTRSPDEILGYDERGLPGCPAMVIDTSALLAILLGEVEAEATVRAVAKAETRLVGTPTLVEASAVIQARKGPGGDLALDALVRRLSIETVPFTDTAAALARLAHGQFGKGTGSPGVLNYGDCQAYGMSMSLREPLLFKGGDFHETDVTALVY